MLLVINQGDTMFSIIKKDHLYLVKYNITFISKKYINLIQHYTDIVYFSRLARLKNLNVLSTLIKVKGYSNVKVL